ncbi:MAG: tripartite tricarboxylate transporter substrate binding protein [Betaproteobacteria bacterium]|nr:tripartite tricarboxylate transporter substrate binding protein [Betaproteobacteria bacterium]
MGAHSKGLVVVALCFGLWSLAAAPDASAQGYPNRAIRMVVAFAPGGASDTNARIVSQKLSEQLAVPVVVDNRPGAGSMLGTEIVARAAPDGYTLLTASAELSINPSLQPKIPYDALKDFAPISQTVSSQYALSTHPSVPVKSVKEFIALAKARPGQLNYGSSGVGSANHLAGALFQEMTGTKLVHIPFKGAGPATIALMGGEIDFMFSSTTAVVAQVKLGRLRAIAVTGPKRFSEMPNIPTVSEAGLPGFVVTGWFGVVAPAGTPREIINKLGAEIVKVVQQPAVQERFASLGTVPVGSSPQEFAAFLRAEIEKWSRVVKASGARPD